MLGNIPHPSAATASQNNKLEPLAYSVTDTSVLDILHLGFS